jgi:flagellar hook protein FlgE
MGSDRTTIQSLKAVDAWIDVINANINGGVRTAFKSSRLKFAGSNTDLIRAGTTSSLPLQFPESSLTTANSVIDFSQGAITTSTERTHLAIQGRGFFVLNGLPDPVTAAVPFLDVFSRDGEFRVDSRGLLCNSQGLYLYDALGNDLVYDDSVVTTPPVVPFGWGVPITLTAFLALNGQALQCFDDPQSLQYTRYGSTFFNYTGAALAPIGDASTTVLTKSLEASNASMTQSVPELSLAQKLFSALTKVLQTSQTNLDNVLNLVR